MTMMTVNMVIIDINIKNTEKLHEKKKSTEIKDHIDPQIGLFYVFNLPYSPVCFPLSTLNGNIILHII